MVVDLGIWSEPRMLRDQVPVLKVFFPILHYFIGSRSGVNTGFRRGKGVKEINK